MNHSIEKLKSAPKSTYRAIAQFAKSLASVGPHKIPQKRKVANEYHRFFSIKAGMRIVECESPLEEAAIIWAESRTDIKSVMEQSLRIHGAVGKKSYHTLDVAFTYIDGRTVHYEVKPKSSLTHHFDGSVGPANWPFIAAWGKANGVQVDIITDEYLKKYAQTIENWRVLLPFAIGSYEQPDPILEDQLLSLFANGEVWSIAQVHERHPNIDTEEITGHVAKLLHQGKLEAILDLEPVSPSTTVCVAEHEHA